MRVAKRMYRKGLNHGSDIRTGGEAWFLRNFPGKIRFAIDVGLNHGQYSLELLQNFPDAEIIGFEAVPEFAQYCASNLPQNIKVIERALSNLENGQVFFFKKGGGRTPVRRLRPALHQKISSRLSEIPALWIVI